MPNRTNFTVNNQNSSRSMPLQCDICPKRPDFSDVSHLLTHVSSKGHLSNYFRMKVKGSQDPIARKAVEVYDAWYNEWNVDELMRERLSLKEKKRAALGQTSRKPPRANTSSRNTLAPYHEPRRVQNRSHTTPLDPDLDRRVKIEPLSRSITPATALSFDSATRNRSYAPPMHPAWTTPYDFAKPVLKQESYSSSFSDDESTELFIHRSQRTSSGDHHHRPSASLPSLPSLADDEYEPTVTITDSSKLKGVYWPGMAMFDAALPEARRKRNQKKETSVLQQLQATSEVVEPTELVFDGDGTLRKQRTITGHPESEDSLIEGESSPFPEKKEKKEKKRARKTRHRLALTEKNPNNGYATRRRGEKRAKALYQDPNQSQGPFYEHIRDDDDDDLTYLASRPRPQRSGLSIHRDNSGPEITFDHPAPFNYLTASFRDPFQNSSHNDPIQPQQRLSQAQSTRLDQRVPSWNFNGTFRPVIQNSMPPQNFPSFGQYISHTIGHSTAHGNPVGHHGFTALEHPFAPLGANDTSVFPPPNNIGSPWNMFAFDHQDLAVSNTADSAFSLNPDVASTTALFFDSNQGGARDDDQATLSATSEN